MVSSEKRRKQLAREKYLRQQQRREERRRRARIRNISLTVAAVLVAGAGTAFVASGGLDRWTSEKKDSADGSPGGSPSKKPSDPCDKPDGGKPNGKTWKKEPALEVDESATYAMTLETTCGEIGIEMDASKTPRTVNSFRFLTGEKFFDNTRCHRLVDSSIHVLQCGDPLATGKGGPGYTLPDENLKDPKVQDGTYPAGTVAMANRYDARTKKGRDTGGSQFFLVFEDSELPPDFTPFGKITEGMDVLKKIAKAGSTPDPKTRNTEPNATVVIEKAAVRKS